MVRTPRLLATAAILVALRVPSHAQDPGPVVTEKEAQEALKKDDPGSHLTYGVYLAQQGMWDNALWHLAKVKEQTIKDAIFKEQTSPTMSFDRIETGDRWYEASEKVGKYRPVFFARAMYWYCLAWPDVVGDPQWADKLRTRLRKLQQRGTLNTPFKQLPGWPSTAGKVFSSTQYAAGGTRAVKLTADPKTPDTYVATAELVAPAGKEYVLTAWALSDGTDTASDNITVEIWEKGKKLAFQQRLTFTQDTPYWKSYTYKDTFPANAFDFRVKVELVSKAGSLWVDEVSLKVDGKELLKNGSLE